MFLIFYINEVKFRDWFDMISHKLLHVISLAKLTS